MRAARKKAYHHGDLRRALVEAATKIIEDKGPAHLTLREAARLAGVSVAAPYRHFADKDALLAAVVAAGFLGLAAAQKRARARAKSPVAALEGIAEAYLRFAEANAPVYRLMFGPMLDKTKHPELHAAGLEALGELLGAVAECQERGLLVKGDQQELALAGWALVHGLASLHTDGALKGALPMDVHRAGERLTHFLLHGMLKR